MRANKYDPGECLYVIHATTTPYYKIGISRDINKRLYTLRSSFPFVPLQLIHVHYTNANRPLEGALHKRFSGALVDNEWFRLSEEDVQFLRQDTETLMALVNVPDRVSDESIEEQPGPYSRVSQKASPKHTESSHRRKTDSKEDTHPRLRRIPDGEKVLDKDLPTIEDEFRYGLLPEVRELYEQMGTWQKVADHYGVPKHVVWNIVVHEMWPIDWMNDVRAKLGLSGFQSMEAMPPEVE